MSIKSPLPSITPYTFGTMSLGKTLDAKEKDIAVARLAMEKKVWFHSSRAYANGGTFEVLRQAFSESPREIPKCIFKITCESAESIEDDVTCTLSALNCSKMAITQLSGRTHDKRAIVDDFIEQGPMYQACHRLKRKGLVDNFVFEIFYSYASDALKAVQHDLFDGYIFYYSLLERQVSNEIMHELTTRNLPVLSLRPVAGAFLVDPKKNAEKKLKDPNFPAFQRLEELASIYAKSGCESYLEFCVRFLASTPNVMTTIGGTANPKHLQEYIDTVDQARPLATNLVEEIRQLHAKWCREADKYKFAMQLW